MFLRQVAAFTTVSVPAVLWIVALVGDHVLVAGVQT
jgi:hypothetical protein